MEDRLPIPPGSTLVAYLRDSGGAEQEASLEQQQTVIREWCALNGFELSIIFKDEALSGTSSVARTAFQSMISHFHNGAAEAGVVVWKFSRFARNLDDAQFYRADLRRRGYQVYSLKDTIPSGPEGRFFEAAIDWMNERYSQDLSSDIRRGLEHLRKVHRCISIRPPVGYMRERVQIGIHRDNSPRFAPRWIIDPTKADLVRRAFELRLQGETYKTIHELTHLYASPDCYVRFFRNPIYLGHLQVKGELQHDFTEPIVDEATWQQVQQRVQHDQAIWSHPRRRNSRYLLSGLARCGVCGQNLFGYHLKYKGTRYDYYRCDGPERPAFSCPKDQLETAVLSALNDALSSPEYTATLYAAYLAEQPAPDPAQTSRLDSDLKETTKALKNILAAVRAAGHSQALLDELGALERRQAELKTQLKQAAVQHSQLSYPEFQARLAASQDILYGDNQALKRTALINLVSDLVVIREGAQIYGQFILFRSIAAANPLVDPHTTKIEFILHLIRRSNNED